MPCLLCRVWKGGLRAVGAGWKADFVHGLEQSYSREPLCARKCLVMVMQLPKFLGIGTRC